MNNKLLDTTGRMYTDDGRGDLYRMLCRCPFCGHLPFDDAESENYFQQALWSVDAAEVLNSDGVRVGYRGYVFHRCHGKESTEILFKTSNMKSRRMAIDKAVLAWNRRSGK